jgi:transposase-like protein
MAGSCGRRLRPPFEARLAVGTSCSPQQAGPTGQQAVPAGQQAASASRPKGVYRARRPKDSPLWRIFDARYEEFEAAYEERFAEKYGALRPVVGRVVERFLKCGILDFGFARVRCPGCGDEYLLAFSCKSRCLCPSCHKKKQVAFGEFAVEEVLAEVPHRHVVFSVPRRVRWAFRRDRRRLAKLARISYATIREFLETAVGKGVGVPGAVACVQSYGDLLDFHPHIHLLVSWGCFKRDGTFVAVEAVPSTEELEKLFRHKVLRMLLDEEAINEEVVKNILSWPHTGFGAFVGHEIPAADRKGREEVARYLAHPPIVVGRILGDGSSGTVVYKADKVHPRHQANFRTFDPLEFIAEVVSHIPNVHEKTAIYYGFYSNKSRGLRKAKGEKASKPGPEGTAGSGVAEGSTAEEDRAPAEVRKNWARLIRKVYEVDPLVCPRCGSEMKIIALIDRPEVIKRILSHLERVASASTGRAPPSEEAPSTAVAVGEASSPKELSYEPLFDDLPFEDGPQGDLPFDDRPQGDVAFDDGAEDDRSLGNSA